MKRKSHWWPENGLKLSPLGELMQERKVTATQLSKDLGIHRSVIVEHKYGQADITGTTLCKLADYFGVTTDYLLGRSKNGY